MQLCMWRELCSPALVSSAHAFVVTWQSELGGDRGEVPSRLRYAEAESGVHLANVYDTNWGPPARRRGSALLVQFLVASWGT